MLGKLTQFKNFIANAVSSLDSHRPTPPSDPRLEAKLKHLLDHVMRAPLENQFKVYHSLQAPQMTLNELLSQVYHSSEVSTDQICQILHFFTFLLNNCMNELVICKIVSDSLVLQLTEVSLKPKTEQLLVDLDEVNSYKIALIKAYVSRIDAQTVKYMILGDRMRVLENCIGLYEQYMGLGIDSFGVQATSIGNSILLMVKYLANNESPHTLLAEGDHTVAYLVKIIMQRVIEQTRELLEDKEGWERLMEGVHDRVMFLLDLVGSLEGELKERVIGGSSIDMDEVISLFAGVLDERVAVVEQKEYLKIMELMRLLVKLINSFVSRERLASVYERGIGVVSDGVISVIKELVKLHQKALQKQEESERIRQLQKEAELEKMKQLEKPTEIETSQQKDKISSVQQIQGQKPQQKEDDEHYVASTILNELINGLQLNQTSTLAVKIQYTQANQQTDPISQTIPYSTVPSQPAQPFVPPSAVRIAIKRSFCLSMQIITSMVVKSDFLLRRNDPSPAFAQLRMSVVNKLVDLIDLILSQSSSTIFPLLCHKSIKFLLLSIMSLSFNQKGLHQYSVLQLHQKSIHTLKTLLQNNQVWDYLVLNYEAILKIVCSSLISLQSNESIEYSFCQFHEQQRSKTPSCIEVLSNAVLITQTCRNYRFMIVEQTKVSSKNIKLQKIYHTNFISAGWSLQPGAEITESPHIICNLTYTSTTGKIPIIVAEDEECLILAHEEAEGLLKVVANIRFKSIQTFFQQKDAFVVKLKGLQQVAVGPPSKMPKQNIARFKEYLIKKRERTRAKQLKFLHYYLEMYLKDNSALISEIGSAELDLM